MHNIGQPELDINLDQGKMALYGVATAQANAVISMAIGGLGPGGVPASTLYEGIKTFDIRVRLPEEYRRTPEQIGELLVPTMSGSKVPIKEIADIKERTGACLIYRDDNRRYAALKFSIRGRDMGSTIAEAQQKCDAQVHLKRGYSMAFQGDFENQQRAQKRLAQVVPISLILIFILLLSMFGNFKDALLVFINVPFAIVGGIAALYITGTNFSISAGIGFIALFGICIQDGIILITMFKENLAHVGGSHSFYFDMETMEESLTAVTPKGSPKCPCHHSRPPERSAIPLRLHPHGGPREDTTRNDDGADGGHRPDTGSTVARHRLGKLPAPRPCSHRRYPERHGLLVVGVPAGLRLGLP
jgi:cobalt-zinc-cadmium resistance protein CzcA